MWPRFPGVGANGMIRERGQRCPRPVNFDYSTAMPEVLHNHDSVDGLPETSDECRAGCSCRRDSARDIRPIPGFSLEA